MSDDQQVAIDFQLTGQIRDLKISDGLKLGFSFDIALGRVLVRACVGVHTRQPQEAPTLRLIFSGAGLWGSADVKSMHPILEAIAKEMGFNGNYVIVDTATRA